MRMLVISYKKSNLIDTKVCGRQQFFGFFNPDIPKIIPEGITGFLFEQCTEIIAV